MASPLEQAVLELQNQLEATQEQMRTLATNYDGLKEAHQKLKDTNDEAEKNRSAIDAAMQARMDEIANSEAKLQRLLFNQQFEKLIKNKSES